MTQELALSLSQDIIQQLKQSAQELPVISIAQAKSEIVEKEDKCKAGDIYIWQGKEPIGITIPGGMQQRPQVRQEVKILVGHYRPVATRMVDGSVESKSHNWNDPVFQQIRQEAANKVPNAMVGFEHLVKVLESDNNKFLGWALAVFTRTAAQAAPVDEGIGYTYMFRSRFVETKKFSWWTPQLTRTTDAVVNLQEEENYLDILQKFLEPTTFVDEGISR